MKKVLGALAAVLGLMLAIVGLENMFEHDEAIDLDPYIGIHPQDSFLGIRRD